MYILCYVTVKSQPIEAACVHDISCVSNPSNTFNSININASLLLGDLTDLISPPPQF